MRHRLDKLLVALYVTLAALPVLAMVLAIQGRPIFGVWEQARRPKLSTGAVITERYQRNLTQWFESNLGLKGNALAIDNALLYHLFGETKYGAFVRIGRGGILYPHEDINYYNKSAAADEPAYIEHIADQIADVQRRLGARGRAFVPVIIPSKTTVWRDEIPARWIVPMQGARPALETTQRYREALRRRGVRYVDAIELFARSSVPRQDLFGRDARHWTSYGACLANREVATMYAELTGKPRPAHDCPYVLSAGPARQDDSDLWRLLNAYFVPKLDARVPAIRHAPPPGSASGPRTLFIGTSFCWALLFDADASGVFGPLYYNYYNQTFVDGADQARIELKAGSPTWRKLTMDQDLYVLDLFESYLAGRGSYVELFLTDLLAELDRSDAELPRLEAPRIDRAPTTSAGRP